MVSVYVCYSLRSSASWTRRPVIRWVFFSVSSPKSSRTSFTFFSSRRTEGTRVCTHTHRRTHTINIQSKNNALYASLNVLTDPCNWDAWVNKFYQLVVTEGQLQGKKNLRWLVSQKNSSVSVTKQHYCQATRCTPPPYPQCW